MKLIASLTSPYARKVRIVLAEKKIDCPLEIENPWSGETRVSGYNPLGKVPVLELDDGMTLYDSRVIVEYLDNISPVSRLFPDGNRQSILVRRWEALADGIIDAAVAIVLERRRPADKICEDVIERQREKIDRGLETLSRELGERPWCHGDGYSLADIATGCCLGYLDFRFPEIAWKDDYPNLKALQDKLQLRASFVDTLPPAA
ncbi:glutathione S-transferase [Paludibacterium paludis]|uniref:Glutathione S-transferase n=1 Tax=Paludibacterium paludis TaxID=1225769 RepID=A0A918P516_9NEIS|nr:glutathione S-transferase [Paludibacterium paludis]GGY21501.1 glutathione S-transferase [Paludibacterium paludis]